MTRLTQRAWFYIFGVFLVGAVLSGLAIFTSPVPESAWLPLAGLTLLATLSQLFAAEIRGRQTYYPHIAFFFAGVLLLPPSLFPVLVVVPHVFEWAKERILRGPHLRFWYIQPFNIAAHIIASYAAYWSYQGIDPSPLSSHTPLSVLAVTVAVVVYVAINHALVGMALVLARDLFWQESRVLGADNLLLDFILAYLRYIVAVLVQLSLWLAIPALAPLVLVHKLFALFRLRQNDLTDEQTGLWNARHFNAIFNAEMERAKRFNRYLTIIMADLDLPDELSKTYGSLAFDTVLAGIGRTFRRGVRQYDIAARFESQRFTILLPETNPFEALVVAERLRASMQEANFQVETSSTPIQVTISVGVAGFPGDAVEPDKLLQAAVEAVRYARLKGGDRVACFPDVPLTPTNDTGLKLKGEIYAPTESNVGFASPAFRHPQSR